MSVNVFSRFSTGRIAAIALFLFVSVAANAASVSMGVTFGNPQSNGGDCVGKGVCRESLDGMNALAGGTAPLIPGDAVTVSFITSTTNPNVVLMRFSLSELTAKQPTQVASFYDPEGYLFDNAYALTKPFFQSLALIPGAMVPANVRFTVQITEDVVTVYIPYTHA